MKIVHVVVAVAISALSQCAALAQDAAQYPSRPALGRDRQRKQHQSYGIGNLP